MVYIKFEQSGTTKAKPALLGVLRMPYRKPGGFTIYLLEPRLTRAAVASRVCKVADLSTAIAEVLAADGPIVSWGDHDVRIVRRAALPSGLLRHFERRSVNGLIEVRRWKNRLYREWNLPSLDKAAGHALKIYMKAVGYRVPCSLAPGEVDEWLRHVLDRLQAASGDYRKLSALSQRRWHALLESNRHNLFGMRAIHDRARRELALEAAYRQTTYRVEVDGTSYPVRIGRPHRSLDRALRAAGATRWACITAFNPQSGRLSARENRRRAAVLKRILHAGGIRWHATEAVADDGAWPPELGVFALGVSDSWAERIGREFDQAAIVCGRVGGNAELVWCTPLQKVTRRSQ